MHLQKKKTIIGCKINDLNKSEFHNIFFRNRFVRIRDEFLIKLKTVPEPERKISKVSLDYKI